MRREWWSGILRLLHFQKETKTPSLRLQLGRVFHHNLTLWLTVLLLSAYFPALVFWHAWFMQLKTRGGMMEFRWSRAKRWFFFLLLFRRGASLIPLLLNGNGAFFKWAFKSRPYKLPFWSDWHSSWSYSLQIKQDQKGRLLIAFFSTEGDKLLRENILYDQLMNLGKWCGICINIHPFSLCDINTSFHLWQ